LIFDGVINSYFSGWQGDDVISDPVVEGIAKEISRIKDAGYAVVIQSSRASSAEGYNAIMNYLAQNDIKVDGVYSFKPPAVAYIDDRAILFNGDPTGLLEKIQNLKPWNSK